MIDGIIEFTYRPKADKKRSYIVFFALLALSVPFIIASVTADKYRGLFSIGSVIFLIAATFIFSKYIAGEYAYAVIYRGEENPEFLVTRTIGKRVTTLYNVPMSHIYKVCKKEENQHQDVGAKKYSFLATLFTKEVYIIKSRSRYGQETVFIEATEEVASRIYEYAAKAVLYEQETED